MAILDEVGSRCFVGDDAVESCFLLSTSSRSPMSDPTFFAFFQSSSFFERAMNSVFVFVHF